MWVSSESPMIINPSTSKTIERDWMIFQFIKGDCSLICDDAAYVARQANIALNRESIRVSRFLLSDTDKKTLISWRNISL